MPIPTTNSNNSGQYLQTTFTFDVGEIYSSNLNDDGQLRELLVRLYQNLNNMLISLNDKESGTYTTNQFVNGQVFFPSQPSTSLLPQMNRFVTRVVIDFGALPNAGTKSVAHGIDFNSAVSFTRIYGVATDPINLIALPLPYASPVLASNIELNVDATNVNVITGSNRIAFTTTYIVLEFLTY